MKLSMLSAATPLTNKGHFNPTEYKYIGVVTVGKLVGGGAEYGYMDTNAGSLSEKNLDGRLINRISWKDYIYYSPTDRQFVITCNGKAPIDMTELVMVADGEVIIRLSERNKSGNFNSPMYSDIFLTGVVPLPKSGQVTIYIK